MAMNCLNLIIKSFMSKPLKIQADKLIGTKFQFPPSSVTDKDTIIYALGIGFSKDPLREEDYKFTYEIHQDFTIFPTMGVIMYKGDVLVPILTSPHMPEFNPFNILYAEQKLIVVKDKLEIGIQYEHEGQFLDVADKGKNAFLLIRVSSYVRNQKGERELAFVNEGLLFIKGLGGINYQGKGLIKPQVQIPNRNPDFKIVGETFPGQAFLYRLSGDINPLHVDPNVAQSQKFERPIIHGLATFGTIVRVIVQQILKNDESKVGQTQVRFVGHVFPGQTLDISVWKSQKNTLIYEATVRERKTKAAVGYVQIRQSAKL